MMSTKNNDSRLLYLQARYHFEKAMKKFESGQIKNEPQLIQTVFQSFQSFFTEMGKPHMIPRYAEEEGPPWSEDYNNMMDEIKEDLILLFEEIDILGRSLYSHFNHNVMQEDIVEMEYQGVLDKLKDLEMYAGYSHEGVIRFGRDDFFNGFKIDYDRITGVPLELTSTGVSLPLSSEVKNVAESAKITIVPGNQKHDDYIIGSDSNGFPGNNNEVSMVSDDLLTGTTGYQFIGKDDNHGNYGTIIDGNPNTWFEYEKVNLRDHEKRKITKNLGWDYVVHGNKTLRFAEDPDNGVLRLHLQIVLEKEEIINQVNLNMYTPPNYGARPAIVKNILVSNETNAPVSILSGSKQDTDYSFRFDPMKAKVISVLLEQEHKYFTDLGHIFYEQKMNVDRSTDYVFETLSHKVKAEYAPRVDGPKVNLESLGVQVDVNETNIQAIYPFKQAEEIGYSIEDVTNDLLQQVDETTIESGVERFEGWRYCIGIRDIEILSCEYQDRGELVTKPYYFDKPVERIAISAQETIGNLLAKNSMMKYNWVKYFISIDDGKEWNPITPLEHEMIPEDPPKLYTIQHVSSEDEIIEEQYGYLETTQPIYSMRLKVVIERPEDEEFGVAMFQANENSNEIPNRYASSSLQQFSLQVQTYSVDEDNEASTFTVDHRDSGYESLPPVLPPDVIPTPPSEDVDEDDSGIPPGGGYDPSAPNDPVMINLNNNPEIFCYERSLSISGTVTSSLPITRLELRINNEYIDLSTVERYNLQLLNYSSTDENCIACQKQASDGVSMQNLQAFNSSDTQRVFNWNIPYKTLVELGLDIGDTAAIQIIAEDEESIDTETLHLLVEECPEPAECYELLSVIIHYFNEDVNEIRELELAKELLPYEHDNGEGVNITVGWDNELHAPVVMITDGYHEGENAFILHAVGIRYMDYDYEEQVIWSQNIARKSAGVINEDLMLGAPDSKDTSWLQEVSQGNYEFTPSLNRINDYVIMSVGNEFVENHCPIEIHFNPEEHKKPEQPPVNSGEEDIYECIQINKIFVQYYDTDQKRLRIKTVDLDDAFKTSYSFRMNDNQINAMIGWYEYLQGASVSILSDNNQPLHVSSVGALIRDKQGIVRTIWANGTRIKTNFIEKETLMYGPKKEASNLSWIASNGSVLLDQAPYLYREQSAVVFSFEKEVTENLCLLDNPIDDLPDKPSFDLLPPVIQIDPIVDPFYYHNLNNETISLTGKITDETDLNNWILRSLENSWGETFNEKKLEVTLNLDIPINIPPIVEEVEENNKVDIVFVMDTSGSMSDELENVKSNMSQFISLLNNRDLDVQIGYVGSRFNESQLRRDMTPSSEFNFNDLALNSGAWETLNWRQITDTTYGAASFYGQLRPDAKKHIVLVTDTYINTDLTNDIIDDLKMRQITVSVIWRVGIEDEPEYALITDITNGLAADINNPNFYEEMEGLAQKIIDSTSHIPDSSQVIMIEAVDEAGNKTTESIVVNFTDYNNPNN